MFPAISIRRVSKYYGDVCALADINLVIDQGEFFALLGPNGAGKTTLISIIAGLTHTSRGTVKVMGHDVLTQYQTARRMLGVVPQELVFDPFFTVRETLTIQSGYYGIKHNDAWIDEVIQQLGLSEKADTNMRALSGGMKRRVLVAQALVHKPPVIILDEPTAGVDVTLRQTLWHFITQLNRQGHTIILTTHYLEEAEALCNRVAMLKQGSIVALDSIRNLLSHGACLSLRLRLSPDTLPGQLQTQLMRSEDGCYILQLYDYAEIETILRVLRESGCRVLEMNILQSDLEEVFVNMMTLGEAPAESS